MVSLKEARAMREAAPGSSSQRVAIGDLIERINDRRIDPAADGFQRFVGVDDLNSDDLTVRRWGLIDDGNLPPTFRYAFPAGAVLFPTRRPALNKCAVAPFAGITGEKILALRSKDNSKMDPAFMPFLLASEGVRKWVIARAIGSVTPHFRWRDLAEYEFVLPSLEEQRRVVEVLRAAETMAEALMTVESCSHGLQASHLDGFFRPRVKSGARLTTVARVLAGNTPTRSDSVLWGGDRPWASGKDLKVRRLSTTEETLTEAGWEMATIAPPGATLVVVRGMILAHTFPVTQCEGEMAFNQDLRALVAGPDVDPDYLLLWMTWAAPWFLRRTAASSHGTRRIAGDVFHDALVPVPALSIQKEFVDEHQSIERGTASVKSRIGVYQRLKRMLVRELLETPR
jgi:type I restriction enzyme S subunit